MTISAQNMRVVYTGNGVTTNFPASFSAMDDGDVEVYLYEIATGDLDLLSGAVYNLNGVPGDTFSVDYPLVGSPIASTHKLVIQRIVDLLQPTTFSNAAGFDPATLTEQLDEMTRMIQQVNDGVQRAVKVDISGTGNPDDYITDLDAAVNAAEASAAAAATAETNAETAETNAETAETNAETAATNAANSAAAALTSENNAETAETNAAASAATAAAAAEAAENAASAIPSTFDSSTVDADPGNGEFRLNHATPASATAIYIDNLDADGVDISALLDAFDDSTSSSKGILQVRDASDSAVKYFYIVTGSVVNGTGYRKLTLTYASGSGVLAGLCFLSFARTGDQGASGAGTGDVVGPASAVDNRLAAFDGTTGKLIKDSGVTIANILTESEAAAAYQPLDGQLTAFAANTGITGTITVSTSDPSGGADGDLWLKYTA